MGIPHRNMSMVPRVLFGAGSFSQLSAILEPKRQGVKAPFVFLVDDCFANYSDVVDQIPTSYEDRIVFVSSEEEPTTEQVDLLVQEIILQFNSIPSGIIGIGGGSVMDLAKAVSLLLTNSGSASDYQGWDLVQSPSVFHVGIPTISGTGAEVSRTTVLKGPVKKLGINSDYTTFDQVILDPNLTIGVPAAQRFYTGMDCFIHCIESLEGTFLNPFSRVHGEKAKSLCEAVFLPSQLSDSEKREYLMMASWMGGISIANSQVGIVHALSYGLSFVKNIRHGVGNCIVIEHLNNYYPKGLETFRRMRDFNEIELPTGICENLSENQWRQITSIALSLEPLWENALGKNWKSLIDEKEIRELYEKM